MENDWAGDEGMADDSGSLPDVDWLNLKTAIHPEIKVEPEIGAGQASSSFKRGKRSLELTASPSAAKRLRVNSEKTEDRQRPPPSSFPTISPAAAPRAEEKPLPHVDTAPVDAPHAHAVDVQPVKTASPATKQTESRPGPFGVQKMSKIKDRLRLATLPLDLAKSRDLFVADLSKHSGSLWDANPDRLRKRALVERYDNSHNHGRRRLLEHHQMWLLCSSLGALNKGS